MNYERVTLSHILFFNHQLQVGSVAEMLKRCYACFELNGPDFCSILGLLLVDF